MDKEQEYNRIEKLLKEQEYNRRLKGIGLTPASLEAVKGVKIKKDLAAKIRDWVNGRVSPFLVLEGGVGTGKTTAAMKTALSLFKLKKSVLFKPVLSLYRESTDFDSIPQLLNDIEEVEYLIIDDLSAGYLSEWRASFMFEVIDIRYLSRKKTLITTNDNLREIDRDEDFNIIRMKDRIIELAEFYNTGSISYRSKKLTKKKSKKFKL